MSNQVYETPLYSLAEKHGFKMGACFSFWQLKDEKYLAFMKDHFNSITCTNETKAYCLLDQQACQEAEDGMPRMNYFMADQMITWARENGLKVRGHVLVWDAFMKEWYFHEGYDSEKPFASKETIRARTRYYIDQVIRHFEEKFPGVIYCWDVVNEAIGDHADEWDGSTEMHIRTVRSGVDNLFKTHMGDDYVEYSFLCAKDTVDALGADIRLIYNDYNMYYPWKRKSAILLADSINHYAKDANGHYRKLCDGIGMQGYIGGYGKQQGCMDDNDIPDIIESIRQYAAPGLEVHITEMAIRNYENDAATLQKHADFCGKLYAAFRDVNTEEKNILTCVAIWGVQDHPNIQGYGYRMNGPYCGLIDENYNTKASFDAVYTQMSK